MLAYSNRHTLTYAENSDKTGENSGEKGVALIPFFILGNKEYSIYKAVL